MPQPKEQVALRRRSVRLGRRFAGDIAARLDMHPGSKDNARLDEEKKILELARDVLAQPDPDPCTVTFLTQAVEMHEKAFGFSKPIYDELFKLHQKRTKKSAPAANPPEKSPPSVPRRMLKA